MLVTLTVETNFQPPSFSNKAIGSMNSAKYFSKFYRRHFELIEKYHVSLKKLLQQDISNPEFYGDLVYKSKKIIGEAVLIDTHIIVFC